jgi:hypothetical protein
MREAEKACPEGGNYLNLQQLREQLGKSRAWMANTLTKLGIVPELRRDRMQKVVKHYPPEALTLLREIAAEYPPNGDWMTLNRLSRKLNADREWVERRLKELGFVGEVRCQPGYGKPAVHYPPEALVALEPLVNEYPVADGWVTANHLEEATGTSAGWVRRRLSEMDAQGEQRKDEQGVPRMHYSPEVLEAMLHRKASLDALGGRQTPGLKFRIAILQVLAASAEPLTVAATNSQLEGDFIGKQVYDGLLWLAERGLVSKVEVTGKPKTRWLITDEGRFAVQAQTAGVSA